MTLLRTQLGKGGLTENFLKTLETYFKKHLLVKISVLKSARPEGEEGRIATKKYSEDILNFLGKNFTSKIIGHTIIVRKWRKAPKE
jgi:RNA-binding protein YhbY